MNENVYEYRKKLTLNILCEMINLCLSYRVNYNYIKSQLSNYMYEFSDSMDNNLLFLFFE